MCIRRAVDNVAVCGTDCYYMTGFQVQTVIVYIRRAVDNVAVYGTDCYYMTGPSADSNCVH